jgi:hypothetical protein
MLAPRPFALFIHLPFCGFMAAEPAFLFKATARMPLLACCQLNADGCHARWRSFSTRLVDKHLNDNVVQHLSDNVVHLNTNAIP